MAIFLSSLPLVSTTAPAARSDRNLAALGALTCAYLIVKDDGTAKTQAVLERCARNQLNVSLHYQGQVDGEEIEFALERPTYLYALSDEERNSAIFTLPALVHYSSLPLKLREHLAQEEIKPLQDIKAQQELLGTAAPKYVWWQHPLTLNFSAALKLDSSASVPLGQLDCVIVTSEGNEANYFNYLEPTLYFFDFLLAHHSKGEFTDEKLVSYKELYQLLEQYCSGDENKRKRSLILDIAQKAPAILRRLAPKLRKSLLNTRKLLPVERVNELDGKCLEYLLRLEGDNLREKAQKNKMRILGLTKVETYNLLENRVLKDFLERCITKVGQYQREELDFVSQHKQLTNQVLDKTLAHFKQRCADLSQNSFLATVNRQRTLPKPNFVLQKDHDYKQIWNMYLALIREKRALDQSLVCQQNLYQDVCEILLNAALCHLATQDNARFTLRALYQSNLCISLEQRNGHRVKLGGAAGPFLIQSGSGRFSLEVVSLGSTQTPLLHQQWYQLQGSASERLSPAPEQLQATAPCYLVLTPVQSFRERNQTVAPVIVPIFTIHSLTPASQLDHVQRQLMAQVPHRSNAALIPYFLVSTLESAQRCPHNRKLGQAYLSLISVQPEQWLESLQHLEHTLTSIITEVLDGSR